MPAGLPQLRLAVPVSMTVIAGIVIVRVAVDHLVHMGRAVMRVDEIMGVDMLMAAEQRILNDQSRAREHDDKRGGIGDRQRLSQKHKRQERRHIGRRDGLQQALGAWNIDGVKNRRCQGITDRYCLWISECCFQLMQTPCGFLILMTGRRQNRQSERSHAGSAGVFVRFVVIQIINHHTFFCFIPFSFFLTLLSSFFTALSDRSP